MDIFSKFPYLTNDGEKGLIQNVPLKYSKRAFTQHREANLRYQVVKTCEIPINKSLNNETQLKRFYRHNLSNHAFNKNQARPTLTKAPTRQSTVPKMLPPTNANTGYNNIAYKMKCFDFC